MASSSEHPMRPTKQEIVAASGEIVADVIAKNLKVLFCGINPGLYSGAVGHHFARPGNRFWKALFGANFTDRVFQPDEDRALLALGLGITNIVSRTTARADELSQEELQAGAKRLAATVKRYQPSVLAVLGIGAYATAFGQKAKIGLQPESPVACKVFVLPNPSGLQAQYQLPRLIEIFSELHRVVDSSRS
ncbi:MAG TPA: G/U mismatch-specific DNA glycosylase [Acidimicrobiales bacterium]|nr:G/U mismatch-specific DNA glycosylase [Acidimicrobiales bacterium]